MRLWGTVELADAETWYPSRVLGLERPQISARGSGQLVHLGEVAQILHARATATAGDSVVNPRDIDRGSGAIVSAGAGRGEVGFALNRGLELGDILVPRTSSQPCVLLTEEHRALFFTQQFIALRTDGQIASPCLIWALLSSTNGQTARAVLGSGTTVPRIEANALLDLQIGITSGEQAIKLRDFLPTPAVWLSAVPSWRSSWAHAVLRSGVGWQLSALGDEDEHETVVLGDVATISRPRKLRLVEDVSRAAIFPVLNRRCFAGGPALKPLDWQPAEGTLT